MKKIITQGIFKKRLKLVFLFLAVILCSFIFSVPLLFLSNNELVGKSLFWIYLNDTKIIQAIMMLLGESLFLLVPLVFYGRNTISQNIAKIWNIKSVDRQGIFFMLAILSMMTLYLIFGYTSKRILPPNMGKYTFALVMGSFVMVFLGPFAEEVLFRGVLFSEIISCYQLKPVYVILFQAILFYIVHLVVGGQFALTIFFLGIITGTFVFYTKSLFFSFIFHSFYNAVVVIMDIIDISGDKTLSPSGALLALLFFILSGLFLVFFAKHMKKLDTNRYLNQNSHDIPPAIRRK